MESCCIREGDPCYALGVADLDQAEGAGGLLFAQNEEYALLWMVMFLKTVGAAFVYLSSRLALCMLTFLRV